MTMHTYQLLGAIATIEVSMLLAGCANEAAYAGAPSWPPSSGTAPLVAQTTSTEPLPDPKQPGELGKGAAKSEPNLAEKKAGKKTDTTRRATDQ